MPVLPPIVTQQLELRQREQQRQLQPVNLKKPEWFYLTPSASRRASANGEIGPPGPGPARGPLVVSRAPSSGNYVRDNNVVANANNAVGKRSSNASIAEAFERSWSMLEAMSCEAVVVGSDTDPVKEVIKNNKNGITFDFFDTKALANTVKKILKNPKKYKNIASEARNTIIKNYDIKNVCLPKQIKLVKKIIG